MVVILITSYIASIFFTSNPIGDVHEDIDHEFILLYEDIPHSTDDGLVEH